MSWGSICKKWGVGDVQSREDAHRQRSRLHEPPSYATPTNLGPWTVTWVICKFPQHPTSLAQSSGGLLRVLSINHTGARIPFFLASVLVRFPEREPESDIRAVVAYCYPQRSPLGWCAVTEENPNSNSEILLCSSPVSALRRSWQGKWRLTF